MKKHAQKASSCRVQFRRHNKTLRHHRMPLQVRIPPVSTSHVVSDAVCWCCCLVHVNSLFCLHATQDSSIIHCSEGGMFFCFQ